MTRYRVTIRGDKAELRGYFTVPTEEVLRAVSEQVQPMGILIVSEAPDDYDPFRNPVSDSTVGVAMNALTIYYDAQGHVVRPESIDYQALRTALEAVAQPHLEYYDPARQDRISEHDCTFEDGTWWFGHGMECKHPELHTEPDQGPAANCHLCVGAGGYEDHDGQWVACSCQRRPRDTLAQLLWDATRAQDPKDFMPTVMTDMGSCLHVADVLIKRGVTTPTEETPE